MTRSRKTARAAGTRFAESIANAMAWHLKSDYIERRVLAGANDRGDITGVRTARGQRVVVECKDHARLELSGWVRETQAEAVNDHAVAGFVVHKRRGTADPLEQYVTMTLGDLLRIGWGVSNDA